MSVASSPRSSCVANLWTYMASSTRREESTRGARPGALLGLLYSSARCANGSILAASLERLSRSSSASTPPAPRAGRPNASASASSFTNAGGMSAIRWPALRGTLGP